MITKNDINWGQEFLPSFPDGYIVEEPPTDDGTCPSCRRPLIKIKGEDKPYCSRCYMENLEKYGDEPYAGLSETDIALIEYLFKKRFISEQVKKMSDKEPLWRIFEGLGIKNETWIDRSQS